MHHYLSNELLEKLYTAYSKYSKLQKILVFFDKLTISRKTPLFVPVE